MAENIMYPYMACVQIIKDILYPENGHGPS